MNYKLHAFTWPVILAFLPALFGGLGQNLQQIFNFGPASSSSVAQVSQAKATADSITVTTICFSSQGDINEGNQPRFGLITDKMIKQTVTLSKNTKTNLWSTTAKQPGGTTDSEPVVKIVGGNNKNLYSHYRSSDHQMVLALCNSAVGPLKVDLGWSKDPQACPEGQVRDDSGKCVPKPCPEGQVRDDSGKCVPDPNPCYKSTWTCGAWRTCTSAGIQTRSCTGKAVRSACPSTSEPKPTSTQACTPPVKKVNIFAPKGDTFTSKDLPLLFQAQVKNADGSNDTSTHTFNWLADGGQAQTEKVSGSSYQPTLTAGEHTITVTADPDTWKLTDSKKVTITGGKICNLNTVQDIINALQNNNPIQLPTPDFDDWVKQNENKIKEAMDSMSVCRPIKEDTYLKNPAAIYQKVYDQIGKYTSAGNPLMISLRTRTSGGHQLIALSVSKPNFLGHFSIKVLDSNGPKVTTINCRPQIGQTDMGEQTRRYAVCDYPGLGAAMLESSNVYTSWSQLDDTLDPLKVRQSPAQWLETHFTNINNFITETNKIGVCTGWSTFNIKASFLLRECKP